jgi:hypothetical protein
MAANRGVTYAISAQAAQQQFAGFCDMLRYDAALVIEADSRLIILTSKHAPTEGRWASFGIHVLAQQSYGPRQFVSVPLLREDAGLKLPPWHGVQWRPRDA